MVSILGLTYLIELILPILRALLIMVVIRALNRLQAVSDLTPNSFFNHLLQQVYSIQDLPLGFIQGDHHLIIFQHHLANLKNHL